VSSVIIEEILFLLTLPNLDLVEYLEQTDSWSYMEFLRLYQERLIGLGPFSDDWTALDGAWVRHFRKELEERGKDISKVRTI
jgi:hypothetical protein